MPLPDGEPGIEHADAAGWVLCALDPGDARIFADHLMTCPDCQDAVAEFQPAAEMLLLCNHEAELNTAGVSPPAALEARTLTRVECEARYAAGSANAPDPRVSDEPSPRTVGSSAGHNLRRESQPERVRDVCRPAGSRQGKAGPRLARWSRKARVMSLAFGAAAMIGTGLGSWLMRPAPATDAIMIPLRSASGDEAAGQAVVHHAQEGGWSIHLTVHGLRPLDPGSFYECWYASWRNGPGHPDLITAGTFTVTSGGTATVQLTSAASPRSFPVMEITAEQPGNIGQHGRVILAGRARS